MLWRLFVQDAESRTVFPGVVAPLPGAARRRVGATSATRCSTSRARPGASTTSSRRSSSATRSRSGRSCSCANGGSAGASRCRGGRSTTSGDLIEAMMALYADMPFVLIGDSGQHDPEVYRRIVERYGDRVRAVYIRDVAARGPERAAEVAAMARGAAARPARTWCSRADSLAIAEDAARLGLITPEAVEDGAGAGRGAAAETADSPAEPCRRQGARPGVDPLHRLGRGLDVGEEVEVARRDGAGLDQRRPSRSPAARTPRRRAGSAARPSGRSAPASAPRRARRGCRSRRGRPRSPGRASGSASCGWRSSGS